MGEHIYRRFCFNSLEGVFLERNQFKGFFVRLAESSEQQSVMHTCEEMEWAMAGSQLSFDVHRLSCPETIFVIKIFTNACCWNSTFGRLKRPESLGLNAAKPQNHRAACAVVDQKRTICSTPKPRPGLPREDGALYQQHLREACQPQDPAAIVPNPWHQVALVFPT
jgi:hypothetical protein